MNEERGRTEGRKEREDRGNEERGVTEGVREREKGQ